MTDQKSEDWLPPGWTMKMKVRKNGRRDKYYFSPSSGVKFNSRAEVARYLSSVKSGNPQTMQSNECSFMENRNNVVVEKGFAEEELEGHAFKLKDNDGSLVEFKDDKFSSPGASKKTELTISKARRHIVFSPSSNMDKFLDDKKVLGSACAGECGVSIESSDKLLPEADNSEQIESKADPSDNGTVSAPAVGGLLQKQNCGDKVTYESDKTRGQCRKRNKETNLPRRASKRLAGLAVDPVPEIRSRARRVGDKKSGAAPSAKGENHFSALRDYHQPDTPEVKSETKRTLGGPKSMTESPKSSKSSHSSAGKRAGEYLTDQRQGCTYLVAPENQATTQGGVKNVEDEDKDDEKSEYSLDLPIRELLSDPCIAFAIQTLTETNFETSQSSLRSSESSDSRFSGNLVATKEHEMKAEVGNNDDGKHGSNMLSPLQNDVITKDTLEVQNGDKANNHSGSSLELSFGVSWMDPCIEFAIKTLTDAIPLEYNPDIQNQFQQKSASLKTEGNCELPLSNAGLDTPPVQCFKKASM